MNTPRVVIPVALLAAAIATTPAHAKTAKVKSGNLAWTQVNNYPTAATQSLQRTFMGDVVRQRKGSVVADRGATGPAVGQTSAFGLTAAYTHVFGSAKGKVDAKKVKGKVQFKGRLTFQTTFCPSFIPNCTLYRTTMENPILTFHGKSKYADLTSAGWTAAGTRFDGFSPQLYLQVKTATVSAKRTKLSLTNIVPSLAPTGLDQVFPTSVAYGIGEGPNRNPNTFGSFAVSIKTK